MTNLRIIETLMIVQTIGTAVLFIRQIASTGPTSLMYRTVLGVSTVATLAGWVIFVLFVLAFVAVPLNG